MNNRINLSNRFTYKHTRLSCYLALACVGIVNNYPPLLYLTFQETWNISLAEITFLITLNFITQLFVGVFSVKVVEKFSYRNIVLGGLALVISGFISMVVLPHLLNYAYWGLLLAIVLNGAGGGMLDIIISPIMEALPSENKSASMSLLHSFYSWASVAIILISTIVFKIFSMRAWPILTLFITSLPVLCFFLFRFVPIERLVAEKTEHTTINKLLRNILFYVLIFSIFSGGATEMAISQWTSYFAEVALSVPKATGDVLGLAFS